MSRLAIISGGSRGLGRSFVELYQQAGYQVVEFSRSAPFDCSFAVDFSKPESLPSILSEVLTPCVEVDWQEIVVISNAASLDPIGPTSKKSAKLVLANLNINYVSAVLFISEVIRLFQHHVCKKVIASISSGAALKQYAGWSLYCSEKAGLENFVRTVAVEQKNEYQPFKMLNIDPGVMDTEMQGMIRSAMPEDFPLVDFFRGRKELGELRDPALVASTIQAIIAGDYPSGERVSVNQVLSGQ